MRPSTYIACALSLSLAAACGGERQLPQKVYGDGPGGDYYTGGGDYFTGSGDRYSGGDYFSGTGDRYSGGDYFSPSGDSFQGGDELQGGDEYQGGDEFQGGGDTFDPTCNVDHGTAANAISVTTPGHFTSNHLVCDGADVYYRLDLTAPTALAVDLNWANADDLDLFLYDASESFVTSSAGWDGNREFLARTLEAGTWYIRVYGYDVYAYAGLSIDLTIDTWAWCADDTLCTAGGQFCEFRYILSDLEELIYSLTGTCADYVAPTGDAFGPEDGGNAAGDAYHQASAYSITPGTYAGLKMAAHDVDVFTFTTTAPSTIVATATFAGIDLDMRLWSPIIEDAGFALAVSSSTETLTYAYAPADTYYLYVGEFGWSDVAGGSAQEGSYSLQLQVTAASCSGASDCVEEDRPACTGGACVP